MQALWRILVDQRAGLSRHFEQIAMPLTEGVANLVDDRRELAARSRTKIDADRIEREAEQARHGQQADVQIIGSDPGLFQLTRDLLAQRNCAAIAVIALAKRKQVPTLERKQP